MRLFTAAIVTLLLTAIACDGDEASEPAELADPAVDVEAWALAVCEHNDACGEVHDGGVDGCTAHWVEQWGSDICRAELEAFGACQHDRECPLEQWESDPCLDAGEAYADCWRDATS